MCPNTPKFTVFPRPESLMSNMDRNPVLWRQSAGDLAGRVGRSRKEEEERRRRSLFVFNGYYRGTQGARC
jgi:hypothetical protein